VKFITRINHADKESILTGTFPNISGPARFVSQVVPARAFKAIIPEMILITPTDVRVMIPFHFVLRRRIVKMDIIRKTNKKFIISEGLIHW
jgi:hypothetical protein